MSSGELLGASLPCFDGCTPAGGHHLPFTNNLLTEERIKEIIPTGTR